MNRKFVTEYALGYLNSYTSMVTAHQLLLGGRVDPVDQENLAKCHIYIIAARAEPFFKPETLKHENGMLSGTVCYRIDGEEKDIPFEGYQWTLDDKSSTIDCKYPYREICSFNPDGQQGTYVPASLLTLGLVPEDGSSAHDLNRYEVLYVGQSIGQGNRSAAERLKSHSTLQKILALTNYDYPDKEIMIFMYQFENDQILTSFDGRAKEADNSDANELRLMNAIKNPPNKKQKIGMIEAGLIRYFKPHYNEVFKIKFPSTKHKTLKSCYDLDVSSLVIELTSEELNYFFYSQAVKPSSHHIVKIDLVASQKRLSFFHATDFKEMPGIIK
ncbi:MULTISPECIES: hypothetical protein [Pseudomonas]|uniref:Uncharacterized protein n=2 Tax=Pseudomonas putida group TaxID=136845 RepID=A0A7V8EDU5_PSEPU|nr:MULTISPECIES: hypothetical protein [Pseudomonas]EBV3304139.1 hypothetical protein [Salmonella enterica subsp. enterica serovar Enteritidis]KAF0252807.1 hypothetical protein GN299_21165 [Pseudomonas putida]